MSNEAEYQLCDTASNVAASEADIKYVMTKWLSSAVVILISKKTTETWGDVKKGV